jgi:hypothetical protein
MIPSAATHPAMATTLKKVERILAMLMMCVGVD